ncbi:MAG: diguanylate cyclase [Sulfuricurvum sp.]|uniref:diguanylate cyclase n=1 Tax=Sulfuricurvum sp. TaxID=2025608 RepID=UPI0025DFDE0C|nr:diguanylate cyclase [Sulfuricurvum sp.]MBV5321514.1 diguanylate cyclase [Sulfuricurvum sp.]
MHRNETILAVDDKKENLDVLLDILEDFDVIPVTCGQKALEIIEQETISLILLDIVMPNIDGYEVCKILKSQPATKNIPIIFTTAKTDEDSISKAFQSGANDYVSKPLKRSEVIARVQTQIKLKKTIDDLEYLASRDTMTGVYNRRKFFELSTPIFDLYEENLFVSMLDIDHFKKVNDSFGHDAGDLVIKLVAKTISEMLPENSIFARIGGEEFVAVCIDDSTDRMTQLFENIRTAIASSSVDYNGHDISFTISNGVAQKNLSIQSIDELIKQADLALYDAKNSGRNKIVFR